MEKSFKNMMVWSSDMPGHTLPFYVWIASRKLSRRDITEEVFDLLYSDFILTMGLEDSEDFRDWCKDQFTHYYESI
jgi:hypothetical protein